MSTPTTQTNDVDLARIASLVEQYKADPEAAQSFWSVRTQWTGGFRTATYARQHAPIVTDEPDWLAGTDTAPNPVEQVLAALGSCLSVGYAAQAAARGINLRSLEVEVKGNVDLRVFLGLAEGHAGYNKLEVTTYIDSDADPEQLEELHAAVIGTSPVGNTLERPVELEARLVKV